MVQGISLWDIPGCAEWESTGNQCLHTDICAYGNPRQTKKSSAHLATTCVFLTEHAFSGHEVIQSLRRRAGLLIITFEFNP